MLVHGTRFINVQDKISDQISEELDHLKNLISFGGPDTRSSLRNDFENIFLSRLLEPHEEFRLRLSDTFPLPKWEEVWGALPNALSKISVLKIHGGSEDSLAYSRQTNGISVIAIGGDKLSRGLTLEGLSVSYFLRASNMFDTLMQMGRWFGYRPRYADLCRVYTTSNLYKAFREIALATSELQMELDNMASAGKEPKDYGLKVRTPTDNLLITAANKIRNGEPVAVRFAGESVQALEVYYDDPKAQENENSVRRFIESLDFAKSETLIREENSPNFIWKNVNVGLILEFLSGYEAISTPSFYKNCDPLKRYIAEQARLGELSTWTVALVSKRNGAPIDIAGNNVGMVQRGIFGELGATARFRAVVSGNDESLDLSAEEYDSAMTLSHRDISSDENPRTYPKRQHVREIRPSSRGLLLLYLIEGTTSMEEGNPEKRKVITPPGRFIPSVALSFPTSETARPLTYTVNEVWRKQFGLGEDDGDE
jgi:hypothetical protein